jgi:type VI secretion system protein ImpH
MSSIQKRLQKRGYQFNFFQAVKLLEASYEDRPKIGFMGPADKEVVKIHPNDELAFASSDVTRLVLDRSETGEDKWEMVENFLGLYGPNSASPMYIAEMIAQCPRDEDALRDFFDIFNHRILSLYYRAWKKHNIGASVTGYCNDTFSKILFSMIGFDIEGSTDDWKISPGRLLRYSSFFCSKSRPSSGLENMISDFFELNDVSIVQFFPRRYSQSKSSLSRLSNKDDGGRLGESFVLGETITDIAGQFKIRLGSLTMRQFLDFQPGSRKYQELAFLSKIYVKQQLGFSLELVLKPNESECVVISSVEPVGILGQSSWIGNPSNTETAVTYEMGCNV